MTFNMLTLWRNFAKSGLMVGTLTQVYIFIVKILFERNEKGPLK